MTKKSLTLGLSLVLLAAGAMAQTVPMEIEAGYRWLDLSGSNDMYRTQINERSGFLIRSLTYSTNDFGSSNFADHLRIDASDLGVGPAGSLRFDMGKSNLYRFTLAYRQTNAFSALPAFANPLLSQGIIPGQHVYDRERRMFDADFELQKWSKITPFVGISWNRSSGPGTTTYHLGQDEFLLNQSLNNRDEEIRAGFGFNLGNFNGQVTQGWRSYRDRETLTLVPGANAGNFPAPILGTPENASGISRTDSADGHTPFTNVFAAGQFNRARIIGDYVRSSSNLTGNETESDAGSFASFGIGSFFTGFNDTINSHSKNDTWRGGARAEVAIIDNVDLLAGAQRESRSLEGTALADSLFVNAIPFGGMTPANLGSVLNAKGSLDRTEDLFNVALSARAVGPFAWHFGFSESQQQVTVNPDLSQIIVPGTSQSGTFKRRVDSFNASGSYSKAGFVADATWWHDNANDPILRTDFTYRNRYRVRAGWHDPDNVFHANLVAEDNNPRNDGDAFAYNAQIRQYSLQLEAAPSDVARFHAEVSRFRATTSITDRLPQTFALDTSYNKENGKSFEGGVLFVFAPATLDTSFIHFNNDGTNPFNLDRFQIRSTFKLVGKTGIAAEWNRDHYSEFVASPLGNFNADRYGLYLRWAP